MRRLGGAEKGGILRELIGKTAIDYWKTCSCARIQYHRNREGIESLIIDLPVRDLFGRFLYPFLLLLPKIQQRKMLSLSRDPSMEVR